MYPDDLVARLDLVSATREQRKTAAPAPLAPQEKIALERYNSQGAHKCSCGCGGDR